MAYKLNQKLGLWALDTTDERSANKGNIKADEKECILKAMKNYSNNELDQKLHL